MQIQTLSIAEMEVNLRIPRFFFNTLVCDSILIILLLFPVTPDFYTRAIFLRDYFFVEFS